MIEVLMPALTRPIDQLAKRDLVVGASEQRSVVNDGRIAIASVMTVTLPTDHRAVDDALCSELIASSKRHIELPVSLRL